jgi:tetratricopeptide (TPR) repeat protein
VADVLASVSDELVAWGPLFGAVLDLHVAETPETQALEERFRRTRLADVTTRLLAEVWATPTLLTVEDVHWMDEASGELLRYLSGAATEQPWLILVARRDVDDGFVAPTTVAESIRLGPLSPSDTVDLLRSATEEAPMSEHRAAAIAERSAGNPLFLRELIVTAADVAGTDELPETIDAVLAARIDQLEPEDRHFLRRASVLGRSFPAELLGAVVDEPPGATDDRWSRLGGLLAHRGEKGISFEHGLIRESAYDGLPYRLRRELHARAGDAIRSRSGSHLEEQAELLSLHYLHAHRFDAAWTYSLVAAERAKGLYANVDAADFYERAIESGRHLPAVGPAQLAEIWEALADAHLRAGMYADAERGYRTTRRLGSGDALVQARLALKLAQVSGWLDRYSTALRWITRGLRLLEGAPATSDRNREIEAQQAELLAWYGRFCQEEGHHRRALRWARQAVEVAETSGAHQALADALKVVDWAAMDLGQLEDPVNWRRALTLFEELGDLPSQASVLNMLGGFAYFQGRWTEALDLYGRAQEAVQRTGNDVMDAFCRNNIGEIALEQGHLDQAGALFDAAGRMWRAAGYRSVAATAMCNSGRVARARGEFGDARRLFTTAHGEAQHVGGHAEMLEVSSRLAECLLASGHVDEALSLADESLRRSRARGGVAPQVAPLQRVRGLALWHRGDAAAGDALMLSLAAARDRSADYEVALTLQALVAWRRGGGHLGVVDASGDVEVAAMEDERDRIFERLGVVWTPELAVGATGAPEPFPG